MTDRNLIAGSQEQLRMAIQNEGRKFQECYIWLEKAMPVTFFEEVSQENAMLITHNLMDFHLQEYFSMIHLKRAAIVLCLDSADADLRILENYSMYGIKNYQAYVSTASFPGVQSNLRIATLRFTEAIETLETLEKPFPNESRERLKGLVKQRNPDLGDEEFERILTGINTRFLRSVPMDRLVLALEMFFCAKTRDNCQYEVRYDEDWEETESASMHIVLAWRNSPKHNFLYRLARTIHRHDLVMKRVNATYIDPYSKQNILVMVLSLHGSNGKAAWDVADIPDFLRELVTVKYFPSFDLIDQTLVSKRIITGSEGNLLRAMVHFIHQSLVHLDVNLYTVENVEEGLCRHPELTVKICRAFNHKFDPNYVDLDKYNQVRIQLINDIDKLDTGQEDNDLRRKNVLRAGISMVHYTLKTNFFRINYTALSFRVDPKYLDELPFDRTIKFPELPYGIFFIRGMHFIGFHIRFKDLARGGLRTVYPEQLEAIISERNELFTECYNLALTQHKKNKDIPEAGSKGVIFLIPYSRLESEGQILQNELETSKIDQKEIQGKIDQFQKEQKVEYLHQAQRSFIESLITLVNCTPDGTIRARHIIDYLRKPEYIYLGPDENMHDEMIEWIAEFSKKYGYMPGSAFITSKPKVGINHKEYGVTSLGVNVYAEKVLNYIGIDPAVTPFTVKLSGGPDGDVAGNQICNLHKFYPKTAKLVAMTDISGTIYDPEGLDLNDLEILFKQNKPLKYYAPDKLHEGGFLVDKNVKRFETPYVQQTLCWRCQNGKIIEDWLAGSDMNYLLRNNVHQVKADIFIPAGGRPRTLNETSVADFLDAAGNPTSKCIVEGANLYITPKARRMLEEMGVIIIKDSSANKAGVICSSFEVLCGLALGDETFAENKQQLVKEILDRIKQCSVKEADLLLRTHRETGEWLTEISDKISERINQFTYELLDYLDTIPLSHDLKDPMLKAFLSYCLPTLKDRFCDQLVDRIPEHHKKAIIACHIASSVVYRKGLKWAPSIVDIVPILLEQHELEHGS
jgi:glutamate dehydrogenase